MSAEYDTNSHTGSFINQMLWLKHDPNFFSKDSYFIKYTIFKVLVVLKIKKSLSDFKQEISMCPA